MNQNGMNQNGVTRKDPLVTKKTLTIKGITLRGLMEEVRRQTSDTEERKRKILKARGLTNSEFAIRARDLDLTSDIKRAAKKLWQELGYAAMKESLSIRGSGYRDPTKEIAASKIRQAKACIHGHKTKDSAFPFSDPYRLESGEFKLDPKLSKTSREVDVHFVPETLSLEFPEEFTEIAVSEIYEAALKSFDEHAKTFARAFDLMEKYNVEEVMASNFCKGYCRTNGAGTIAKVKNGPRLKYYLDRLDLVGVKSRAFIGFHKISNTTLFVQFEFDYIKTKMSPLAYEVIPILKGDGSPATPSRSGRRSFTTMTAKSCEPAFMDDTVAAFVQYLSEL